MGRRMIGPGEADYFRDYKRLGPIAKLATGYLADGKLRAAGLLIAGPRLHAITFRILFEGFRRVRL